MSAYQTLHQKKLTYLPKNVGGAADLLTYWTVLRQNSGKVVTNYYNAHCCYIRLITAGNEHTWSVSNPVHSNIYALTGWLSSPKYCWSCALQYTPIHIPLQYMYTYTYMYRTKFIIKWLMTSSGSSSALRKNFSEQPFFCSSLVSVKFSHLQVLLYS